MIDILPKEIDPNHIVLAVLVVLIVAKTIAEIVSRRRNQQFIPTKLGRVAADLGRLDSIFDLSSRPDKTKGSVGELLTSLFMSMQGWKLLPGPYNDEHGIDGIFVREKQIRGHWDYEVWIVETKTNTSNFPKQLAGDRYQMDDVWVKSHLDRWVSQDYLSQKVALQFVKRIESGLGLEKKLVRHKLQEGTTEVTTIDRKGKLIPDTKSSWVLSGTQFTPQEDSTPMQIETHRRYFESLLIWLGVIDHDNKYFNFAWMGDSEVRD